MLKRILKYFRTVKSLSDQNDKLKDLLRDQKIQSHEYFKIALKAYQDYNMTLNEIARISVEWTNRSGSQNPYLDLYEKAEPKLIGFLIERRIKQVGYKQVEAARLLDIEPTHFNHILKGRRKLSFEKALYISDILTIPFKSMCGCDSEDLIIEQLA